jgi:hypothetical protein
MSIARRRLIRPLPAAPTPEPQNHRQIQKLRSRLEHERAGLARWMSRQRPAVHDQRQQFREWLHGDLARPDAGHRLLQPDDQFAKLDADYHQPELRHQRRPVERGGHQCGQRLQRSV